MGYKFLLAYTDPGTGALIWQLIVAAGIGFIFYFRRFFYKITKLFRRKKEE